MNSPKRRCATPHDAIAADDELGAIFGKLMPVERVPQVVGEVLDVVGRSAVDRADIQVVGVEDARKIDAVARAPVGRVGIRGRQHFPCIAPSLEIRAGGAHHGVFLADEPAVDVGRYHAGLSMVVDVLAASRIPAKKHTVRSDRTLEGMGNADVHPPRDSVPGVAFRQCPLVLEVVHIDHLVAALGVGVLVVLDEIGATNLLHPADGRWKNVVVLGAVEVGLAEGGFFPMNPVVGDGIARLIAALRLLTATYVGALEGQGGAVPHLEVAVLLVVQHRAAEQVYSATSTLPGPVGLDDGVFGGTNGTVELRHDVVEGIDDVVVEEKLLRGADVDWRCHWPRFILKTDLERLPYEEKPSFFSFMLTKVRPPMTM